MKIVTMLLPLIGVSGFAQPLWKSKVYEVYTDRIVQDQFMAKAVSNTEIQSNYQSPINKNISTDIAFKFSINGKDNEMPSGVDHHFNCIATNSSCETPLIKFGTQLKATTLLLYFWLHLQSGKCGWICEM